MEFRRNPVTQHWVIQEDGDGTWPSGPCPLCPDAEGSGPQVIYEHGNGHGWDVRVTPHPRPLCRVEGETDRRGERAYDKMRNVGAHEIVIENPSHSPTLSRQTEERAGQVIRACVERMNDLKQDRRFRYIALSRHQGALAGQDWEHPHSQIVALPFIPRSVVRELRSTMQHYALKERCLFCDITQQELTDQVRTIEWTDRWIAFCPYASHVPYEIWILPRAHGAAFEEDLKTWEAQFSLARFLQRILRRVETVTPNHTLVLHTCPNLNAKYERQSHWLSVREDYHWHFELVPVFPRSANGYALGGVLYNSIRPEVAAERLRRAEL